MYRKDPRCARETWKESASVCRCCPTSAAAQAAARLYARCLPLLLLICYCKRADDERLSAQPAMQRP